MTTLTTMRSVLEVLEKNLKSPVCGVTFNITTKAITDLTTLIADMERHEPVEWQYDVATYLEGDLRGRQWRFNILSPTKPYLGNNMVQNLTPLYPHPQPKDEPVQEPITLHGWGGDRN
jgi:hypothetical protein